MRSFCISFSQCFPLLVLVLCAALPACSSERPQKPGARLRETFSVKLPKSEGWIRNDGIPADAPRFFRVAALESEHIMLSIEVVELDSGLDPAEAIENDETLISADGQSVDSRQPMQWHGFDVIETLGRKSERGKPTLEILSRRFFDKQRCYSVSVEAPDLATALERDDVEEFLNSFRLNE